MSVLTLRGLSRDQEHTLLRVGLGELIKQTFYFKANMRGFNRYYLCNRMNNECNVFISRYIDVSSQTLLHRCSYAINDRLITTFIYAAFYTLIVAWLRIVSEQLRLHKRMYNETIYSITFVQRPESGSPFPSSAIYPPNLTHSNAQSVYPPRLETASTR